jgi:hypothetical protein
MASSGSSSSSSGADWNAPQQAGLNQLRALASQAGLGEQHTQFLALVAKGESGLNNLRGLGIPDRFPPGTIPTKNAGQLGVNEARAAERAYASIRDRFPGCPWPAADYGFGSGGWFAFLPAYALAQFPKGSPLRCLPPAAVFDPVASFCMAIGFARGLQGWSQFKVVPTVLNLRGMWGRPSQGGKPERLQKIRGFYQNQARAIGLPGSFVDQQIARFPGWNLEELYYRLGGKPPQGGDIA